MSVDRGSKRLLEVAAEAVGTVLGVLLVAVMMRGVGLGQTYGYVIGVILVASSTYLLVAMVRRRRRAARSPAIPGTGEPASNRMPRRSA